MAATEGRTAREPIVVFALTAAIIFGAVRLLEGASFFSTLTQAGVVAFVLMVLPATARSLWRGDDVEEAEAGGWRVRFSIARRAVGALERRTPIRTRQISDCWTSNARSSRMATRVAKGIHYFAGRTGLTRGEARGSNS